MKLKFLGTAAAEGVPGLFCSCDICMQSRMSGGRNIRKRSSMLLDGKILFDFSPDILSCVHDYKIDLFKVEHLLITHSHSDHFNYNDLGTRLPTYAKGGNPPLNVYANSRCVKMAEKILPDWGNAEGCVILNTVEPGMKFEIDGYVVKTLTARHITDDRNETALLYLVTHGGKSIFYGNDSGIYFDDVMDVLGEQYLSCVILDCTNGYLDFPVGNHMGFRDNSGVVQKLRAKGVIDDDTVVISTHFSHNGGVLYERDSVCFEKESIIMAYDGMEIEL